MRTVTATCNERGMRLQLLSRRPFYGRIYTYRHYDSCSVLGRGSRDLSLFIPAHGCGTQMVSFASRGGVGATRWPGIRPRGHARAARRSESILTGW